MAHVAKECGFCAVQLCKLFGALALLFVGAGIRDDRCDLPCNQVEEAEVGGVKRLTGAYGGHKNASGQCAARESNRQYDQRFRRHIPCSTGKRSERRA